MARELFLIGPTFRAVLKSLEEALGVRFLEVELERVVADAEADQVSPKHYVFFRSPGLSVSGIVDEYEPETVWIEVTGTHRYEQAFQSVVNDRRLRIGPNSPIH